ncbi:MAG TPA: DUF2059 domain-containing protein [Candidatus Acidoferrum sp.]|nr:DUF2059 domain-containing protein [Candidatus Acidoferrum sp.]
MTFKTAMLAVAFLVPGWTMAQTSSQPPHQPGVAAPAKPQSKLETLGDAQAPAGQVDPAKEKAIRQLMELTGSAKLGDSMTEVLTSQVKTAVGRNMTQDRLQKFMEDFNQKLSARAPAGAVTNAEVPIYAQHFSMEDLQGMIQFYESAIGQRMVKALPQVMQESQQKGANIERGVALDTLKEMAGDYPELKAFLPDEQKPTLAPGSQPAPAKPQVPNQPPQKPQL